MHNVRCICRWSKHAHLWSCKTGVRGKYNRWFWLLHPCRYQCVPWGLLEYSAVSLGKWFVLFYCLHRIYLQRLRSPRTVRLIGHLNFEDKDNTVLQNDTIHSANNSAIIPEPGTLNFNRFRTKYCISYTKDALRYVTHDIWNPGCIGSSFYARQMSNFQNI